MKSVKICFWCTSFQADNQALATYLARTEGFEVVVAMDDPARYASEPVNALLPFAGRMLDRGAADTPEQIEDWGPDVLVVDNHLPPKALAPKIFVLWHGFGWRFDDLSVMRKALRKLVGDATVPNPDFRWQAFGEWDRQYRIEHSKFAESNVVALGSAYSDLLGPNSPTAKGFDRTSVQAAYDIDLSRPTVLLGLSWHHGGALGHWGDDTELHERLVVRVGELGGNVLVRLHDRHRYEPSYIAQMEALSRRHAHVGLKFKSDSPDSLVDVLLSDVMISNYSSFLNAFYYTGRPTVHIDPTASVAGAHFSRKMKRGKLRVTKVSDPLSSWKLGPDDIGGLRARSFSELLAAVEQAVTEPTCCEALATAFVARHVSQVNGRTCERIGNFLHTWVNTP